AHGRDVAKEQPAEIPQRAIRVAAFPRSRVDPDLLELHRRRRPRRRLGLEADHAVLQPDPRARLLDLRPRPPTEALRVAPQRIDPDLLVVRGGARGDEP